MRLRTRKSEIFPSGTFELVFNLHDNELRIYKTQAPDPASLKNMPSTM